MTTALILPDEHPWRDEAHQLGPVAYDGSIGGLPALARTPIDVLLLDAGTLATTDLEALGVYRIARPKTRILVFVPDRIRQPSAVMSRLVELGVYDFGAGSLTDALEREASYADAARWLTHDTTPPTKLAYRFKANRGSDTGLVVVAGACPGAGTTTLAELVARTLSDSGRNTVLIDAAAVPGASRLKTARAVREEPRGGHLATDRILKLAETGVAVADVGSIGQLNGLEQLIRRADRCLVAVPCAPHRIAWVEALAERTLTPGAAAWVIVGGSAAQAADTADRLKRALGDVEVVHLPQHNPQAALAVLLGNMAPAGGRMALPSQLRRLATTAARKGGGLCRISLEQVAWVLGRLAGVLAAAAMIAVLAVIVVPLFVHVQIVDTASAWIAGRIAALRGMLP